ncbi:MAG: aldolase/citrate lyase family protein [Lentisphaeria bacterium]|nr:aldolase/citrate lyase family protein [Lentisphaeria bacterium]
MLSLELIEQFRGKIASQPVFGFFSKTCDPAFVEVMGHAQADFVILDMEHGPASPETMQNLIRGAQVAGILPMVRVPEGRDDLIGKVLDLGAGGVQVPHVTTAEDVRRVKELARFHPLGRRGVCRYVRAASYSALPKQDYFQQANEAVICIQLEGKEALENLDAILAEGGFDIVFVGPYDLSQSLGVPGQIDHPEVIAKTREIVAACAAKRVTVGNFSDTPEQAARWAREGIRYLSCSVDVGLFYEAAKVAVEEFQKDI